MERDNFPRLVFCHPPLCLSFDLVIEPCPNDDPSWMSLSDEKCQSHHWYQFGVRIQQQVQSEASF